MADATWPAALPQELMTDNFEGTAPDNVLRTKMDRGPDKFRRKSTGAEEPVKGGITVTDDEYETFKDFWYDTIYEGALAFNWTRPDDGTACEMRFTAPYEYRPAGPSGWQLRFELEILP